MITLEDIVSISKRIVDETREEVFQNRVADTQVAILNTGFHKLVLKLIELEEERKGSGSQNPPMTCGSCGGKLIWNGNGYTHAHAMMERHGAWPVEAWEEE